MSDPAWTTLRDRLSAELATLGESEVVILQNHVPAEEQRFSEPRRRLFGSTKPQPLPSGFMVQFVGQGKGQGQELMIGTCEGPTLVGGHIELTEAEDQEIRALGWRGPGDPDHYESYAPAYTVVEWPRADAQRLAQIAVSALEIEGARADLDWTFDRFR